MQPGHRLLTGSLDNTKYNYVLLCNKRALITYAGNKGFDQIALLPGPCFTRCEYCINQNISKNRDTDQTAWLWRYKPVPTTCFYKELDKFIPELSPNILPHKSSDMGAKLA